MLPTKADDVSQLEPFPHRLILLAILLLLPVLQAGAQQTGAIRGRVLDQSGAVMPGVPVAITSAAGARQIAKTGPDGSYAFEALPPGSHTLEAASPGFAPFRRAGVTVGAGRRTSLDIVLKVTLDKQRVDVSSDQPMGVEPEANAGAIVIKGDDLQSLPDDPDDLAAVLQAMAGPSAGPNGGEIFVDGFSGTGLPAKEAIREIRINQNPFSSEYDRIGFGRIEILTRPGMDKFHGGLMLNFNDESLNSRNPFAANKPAHQVRMYNGNLSGPLLKNRASFFLMFGRREIDDNALIRARTLDGKLNILDVNEAVVTPSRSSDFSPRVDLKLNDNHTLVLSYGYRGSASENAGVGDFSLLSRAFGRSNSDQSLRLTETAILSIKTVNETRFQFMRPSSKQMGDNTLPTINVQDSFTGGGSQVGRSSSSSGRWELQNYTTRTSGRHTIKFGARLRGVSQEDISANNFGGTYTFAGGFGPELDANNQPVPGTRMALTSLERYRRTLLFQSLGLSASQTRALGGGASQLSITGGNPEASVSQFDFGGFVQDDWRVRSNLTLSAGLRYESQNNIHSPLNLAPRAAFAWSPRSGGSGSAKTVIRGGFGIFYDRVSEGLVLQARRFDGTRQQQYIVDEQTGFGILDLFPNVPSLSSLAAFAIPQTLRRVGGHIRAPYTINGSLSLERQLPGNFTVSTSYIRARGLHVLRSRNINAPLPGTVTASNPSGVRPFGNIGNIYEYESAGIYSQNQLVVGVSNRMSRRFTLFATYSLGKSEGDSDGAGSFPANGYDLSGEYGRSSFDVRHRAFLGGSLNLPRGVSLNPFLIVRSGTPFNITAGQDTNGDSVYNERPAFATDLSRPSVVITRWGAFDRIPLAGATIIPRNYGQGPGFVSVNLRLGKTFTFGQRERAPSSQASEGPPPGGPPGGGPGGGPPPGGGPGGGGPPPGGGPGGGGPPPGGMLGSSSSGYRYSLTLSVSAQNLLNHTNAGNPVTSLSSPLFGQSLSSAGGFGMGPGGGGPGGPGGGGAAGNRKIELQLRFSF